MTYPHFSRQDFFLTQFLSILMRLFCHKIVFQKTAPQLVSIDMHI